MSAPAKKGAKRGAAGDSGAGGSAQKKGAAAPAAAAAAADAGDEEELQFEDPYGDEVDEEDEAAAASAGKKKGKGTKGKKGASAAAAAAAGDSMGDVAEAVAGGEDDEEEEDSEGEEEILDEEAAARIAAEEEAAEEAARKSTKYVWRPSADPMAADEKLDYDSTAYNLLHRMRVDWPCLSFDVLPDALGPFRSKYPLTLYMAAGTQADRDTNNKVMLLKLSELHKTKHDDKDADDSGEDSDDDPEDLDEEPVLEERSFAHPGGVNRLRVCPQHPNLIATHSDKAKVHVWNAAPYVAALDSAGAAGAKAPPAKPQPLFTFHNGQGEGYAMAWNPLRAGRMVTGDGTKNIFTWEMKEGAGGGGSSGGASAAAAKSGGAAWTVDATPHKGHSSSVEDLVWSPSEESVFASCSSDRTVRIWDCREKKACKAFVAAHKSDVNVIDWNARVQNLLVSGSDDGSIKVWDLRNFKSAEPLAHFNWHRGPITSVEWHPSEESCVAVSSADNSISIWDMALEHDSVRTHSAQFDCTR
jgi:ribosome assembly protein RRB1